MLKPTKIHIRKVSGQSTLIANISIVFEHILEVRDIRLMMNEKGGYFISMPSRKYTNKTTNEEKYTDIVSIDFHYKDYLKDLIMKQYKKLNENKNDSEEYITENTEILEEEIPF
jgi:DNA-binding cell septation regulator SpoVG